MKTFFAKLMSLLPNRRRNSWVETARRDVTNPKNPLPLDPDAPWNS